MIKWQDKKVVENILRDIVSYRLVEKFYPTFIAKKTNYSPSTIFDILTTFVDDKTLVLEWEIRCNECECCRTLTVVQELSSIKESYSCRYCGEDVEITLEDVFPVFSLADEYREHIMSCESKNYSKKKEVYVSDDGQKLSNCMPINISNILSDNGVKPPDGLAVSPLNINFINNIITTQQCNISAQGDSNIGNSKYDFSGASVNAKDSIFSLGDGNNIKNSLSKTTEDLLKTLKDNYCNNDIDKIQKLEKDIKYFSDVLKEDKPDKSIVSSLISKISIGFKAIKASTDLIEVYQKWSLAIGAIELFK